MDYLYEGEGYFMIELATAIKEVAETSKMLSRLMPDYFKELPSAIGENIYDVVDLSEKKMLSMEEKLKIKEESGWSDEIVDQIKSMEEYEIYKQADVHEKIVDGRPCLCKDIDMDLKYMDPKTGETQTNRERMADGKSPVDGKTGEKIELHHIGQNYDGPFIQLKENSEHGGVNHKILHDNKLESFRNDTSLKNHYNNVDRPNHWKAIAKGE